MRVLKNGHFKRKGLKKKQEERKRKCYFIAHGKHMNSIGRQWILTQAKAFSLLPYFDK